MSAGRAGRASRSALDERFQRVRIVVMDCDGVLTDGGMYYSETGDEWKKFNTRDGKGVELLGEEGYLTAIITSEDTAIVSRRAAKMKVDVLLQGITDKTVALEKLLAEKGLDFSQVAYVGDDLGDLDVMKRVGLACAVADGIDAVVGVAHYVCERRGGQGAVREVADLILASVRTEDEEAT